MAVAEPSTTSAESELPDTAELLSSMASASMVMLVGLPAAVVVVCLLR